MSLLQTLEELIHEVNDHTEREFEGNFEQLGDPRDSEECQEADEETDDGVAYCVDGLLDLLLVASGENECDATEDDVEKAEDRCDH